MNIREFVREAPVFYALAIAVGLSRGGDLISKREIQENFSAFFDENNAETAFSYLDSEPLWNAAVHWLSTREMIKVKKLAFGSAVYSRGDQFPEQWSARTSRDDDSAFATYGKIRNADSWLRGALQDLMKEEERLKPTLDDYSRYIRRPRALDQFDVPDHAPVSDPPELTEDMDPVEKTDAILEWFHSNFEDPVHSTPYNSREGGYLYINGGPYEVSDIFESAFPGYEEDEVLSVASRELEDESSVWVPSAGRAIAPEDDDLPIEYLHRRVVRQAEELQELLKEDPVPAHGIGHNKPPEAIDTTPLQAAEKAEVIEALEVLKTQPPQPQNAEASQAALATLRRNAKKISAWVGNQGKVFVEEAIKESGKQTGKWATPVFWAVVLDNLTSLTARANAWIKALIVLAKGLS